MVYTRPCAFKCSVQCTDPNSPCIISSRCLELHNPETVPRVVVASLCFFTFLPGQVGLHANDQVRECWKITTQMTSQTWLRKIWRKISRVFINILWLVITKLFSFQSNTHEMDRGRISLLIVSLCAAGMVPCSFAQKLCGRSANLLSNIFVTKIFLQVLWPSCQETNAVRMPCRDVRILWRWLRTTRTWGLPPPRMSWTKCARKSIKYYHHHNR